MGQAEIEELRDNARAWVEHIKTNVPPDIGAMVVFFNRRTGDAALGCSVNNPKGVQEILRSVANNITVSDNLVIPASSMPKM